MNNNTTIILILIAGTLIAFETDLKKNQIVHELVLSVGVTQYDYTYTKSSGGEQSKEEFLILQYNEFEISKGQPNLPVLTIMKDGAEYFDSEKAGWIFDEAGLFIPLQNGLKWKFSINFRKTSFLKKVPFQLAVVDKTEFTTIPGLRVPVILDSKVTQSTIMIERINQNFGAHFSYLEISLCQGKIDSLIVSQVHGDSTKVILEKKDIGGSGDYILLPVPLVKETRILEEKEKKKEKGGSNQLRGETKTVEVTSSSQGAVTSSASQTKPKPLPVPIKLKIKVIQAEGNTEDIIAKIGLLTVEKDQKEKLESFKKKVKLETKKEDHKQLNYIIPAYIKEEEKEFGTIEYFKTKEEALFKSQCGFPKAWLQGVQNYEDLSKIIMIETTERATGEHITKISEAELKEMNIALFKLRRVDKKSEDTPNFMIISEPLTLDKTSPQTGVPSNLMLIIGISFVGFLLLYCIIRSCSESSAKPGRKFERVGLNEQVALKSL